MMDKEYTRTIEVKVPFEHCKDCPAFELGNDAYISGGMAYFNVYYCNNHELCSKVFEAVLKGGSNG